ncbi:hypothetical protein KKG45_13840 [bacterium]|nr:hypothetical protein [bacterium]MBU1074322.1 hypothetical protein [bacterium]MBU1676288.1 hypothetical protein [bacterium]
MFIWSLILTTLGAGPWTSAAVACLTIEADNGVTARVHSGDDLADCLVRENGALLLRYPGLGDVELYRGPDDPRFPRQDVVEFRPLPADVVIRALSDVHALDIDVEVDVFLLPAPPVLTSSSFARRDAILLAPSFGDIDDSAVASVAVHELGHVLTWVYFDPRAELWDAYMSMRGLDRGRNGPGARHADRAREILAEDIRYLFGGGSANVYGAIENARLALPDEVVGLSGFLAAAMQGRPVSCMMPVCSAFPNPCNPRTTIEMTAISDGMQRDASTATLEVFDMRGRCVCTVAGGVFSNDRLLLTWDGRDDAGNRAPSGRYLYVAGWRDLRGRGAVTLVK